MEAPTPNTDIRPLPPAPPPPRADLPDALPADRPPLATGMTLSPLAVRLRLLARAHAAAARGRGKRLLLRLGTVLLVLLLAGGVGTAAGFGVFWIVYDAPERYAQHYSDGWTHTYYIQGRSANQQQYDYYLQTNSNFTHAVLIAVPAGVAVGFVVVLIAGAVLRRKGRAGLEDGIEGQVAGLGRDYPDRVAAWGGEAVLRQPDLVDELLRLEAGPSAAADALPTRKPAAPLS